MSPCRSSHVQSIFNNRGEIDHFYDTGGSTLGSGNSGTVRVAEEKSTGERRAIKTIHKLKVDDMVRFKQEIDIMKMMDHPNVIKLYEHFEDAKNFYLVMELCAGGDLFDHIISTRDFSELHAARLMQQILQGVYYIHQRHVCHRDIKLENFLLVSKGPIQENTLKIIDFGLSSRCEPGQFLKTRLGTPTYVAPEVIVGRYDFAADLWSCGVVLYILLSGCPPFDGKTDAEVFRVIRKGLYSFAACCWQQVSEDAKQLVTSLLCVAASARTTAAQALSHKWFDILGAPPAPERLSLGPDMLQNLRAYKAAHLLKRTTLQIIAWRFLDKDKIKALEDTFRDLDANKDGVLTLHEIKEGLARGGVEDMPNDLQQIVDAVDTEGNGTINYTAFLAATLERRTNLLEDVLQMAFNVFDKDGDGKISPEELREVLDPEGPAELPRSASASEIAERIAEVIEQTDRDGDGMIDFQEFVLMMKNPASGQPGVN